MAGAHRLQFVVHAITADAFVLPSVGLACTAARGGGVDFNRDVRPILSDNCFRCHGFDPAARKGGLRLDDRDGATKTLKSGNVAIVPSKVKASELVKRITSTDADEVMPPPETKKKLRPEQIETLRRWVAEGAVYAKHWSFEAPVQAPIPAVKLNNMAAECGGFVCAGAAGAGRAFACA